jgi:hypothetical protein
MKRKKYRNELIVCCNLILACDIFSLTQALFILLFRYFRLKSRYKKNFKWCIYQFLWVFRRMNGWWCGIKNIDRARRYGCKKIALKHEFRSFLSYFHLASADGIFLLVFFGKVVLCPPLWIKISRLWKIKFYLFLSAFFGFVPIEPRR